MISLLKTNSSRILKSVFAFGLFIILCLGGLTYKHIEELNTTSEKLQKTYETNVELEQILSYLKDAETGQRGFLISKDSVFLEPFFSGRENVNNNLTQLNAKAKNDTARQNSLRKLRLKIDEEFDLFSLTYQLAINDNLNSNLFKQSFLESKKNMDAIRDDVKNMISKEVEKLNETQNNTNRNLKLTPIFLYSLLIFVLLLILITYLKINKDFAELKLKNEKLEYFQELTKQSEIVSQHGNWTWNITRNTYEFSDNLYRLLGEKPQAFVANLENFMSFVHPEDIEFLTERVGFMLENKHFPNTVYRVVHKNGTVKHLKAFGKTLYTKDGDKSLLGTTTDVTEDIENLKIIKARNEELELNNKELSAFNYVASHDLQEPLRKIQTFISRLNSKDLDQLSENGKTYLLKIEDATVRMRSLIDDLLQFSRTNKAEKTFEISNLNELLESAKNELAEIIEEKQATITSDILPELNVISFQIQQLFINLINNAIKYSKKDLNPVIHISYKIVTGSPEALFKNSEYKQYHQITFKDNGIGFEQEYAEKIFTLFSRLHDKKAYSGTGIGLSICKKIVENHNGHISAVGILNKGAEFHIYLPKI